MGQASCERVVMIVEDDPDSREVLADLVAEQGFRTVVASNGREALDVLGRTASTERPCVILLDIMMPVMDGRQFRAAQQNDPLLGDIPVVVLSAHVDVRRAARELSAAAFLKKPVDFHALSRIVREICGEPRLVS